MTDSKIIKILNKIRTDGTLSYQNAVPKLTEGDLLNVYGASILNQPSVMNEFLNTFMNYFMYEETKQHIFESEFDRLKTPADRNRFGTFEAFRNTVKPMEYNETDLARILRLYKPDVKTAYFARNRQDIFPMSVTYEELEGAFADYAKFDDFITGLYTQLINSNKVVEYNAIKECINVNVNGGAIKKDTTLLANGITSATAPSIAKKIREVVIKMQKPSTEFNAYADMEGAVGDPVETSTPKKSLLLLADAETISTISIDVLASAFNLAYADFQINLIEIDDFGYNVYDRQRRTVIDRKKSNIKFIICDEALFNIKDTLKLQLQGTNDATLVKQNFYHIWQAINVRPWANAMAFCIPESVEIESDGLTSQFSSPIVVSYLPTTASVSTAITLTDKNGDTITVSAPTTSYATEQTDPAKVAAKILAIGGSFFSVTSSSGSVTIARTTNKSVYAGTYTATISDESTSVTLTDDELDIFKNAYGVKTAWNVKVYETADTENYESVSIPTVNKTIWNK